MLAILFLLAVWLDRSEPLEAVAGSYALLILYALLAVAIAVVTWRNWWLDARFAVPAHAIDMAVFTAIVFSANGSTSPFFLFFVLPLLTAAICWSWRETALTATALVALYLIAGLLVASSQGFELERFVVRSGYLVILSLLLIWFGIHQHFTRLFFRVEDFEAGADERGNPLARALGLAMQISEAGGGALLVGAAGEDTYDAITVSGGAKRGFSVDRALVRAPASVALLCDVARDRALTRLPEGRFRFSSASAAIDVGEAKRLGLTAGLIAEVRTSTQQGWLVLWDIHDLSNDYIDVGRELGESPPRSSTATRWSRRSRAAPPRARACRSRAMSTTASSNSSPARRSGSRRSSEAPSPARSPPSSTSSSGCWSRSRATPRLRPRRFAATVRSILPTPSPSCARSPRGSASNGRSNAGSAPMASRHRIRSGSSSTFSNCFGRRLPMRSATAARADRCRPGGRGEVAPAQVADDGSRLCEQQGRSRGRAMVAQGTGRARQRLDAVGFRARIDQYPD